MRLFGKWKKTALDKSALYFAGWGYDDHADADTYRDDGAEVQVMETAGHAFILRKMGRYVFFRREDDRDERASWFLLERYESYFQDGVWHYTIEQFSPERFVAEYAQQAYGRCLLHVADCMREHQCVFLCFVPDGAGFSLDYNTERMVDFRWQDVTALTWAELRVADPESLRPLCQTIFDTLIHPRLTNPYIDPKQLKKIPHRFLCGSKEELRRLTTIIAQTEPGLFDESREPVTITYRAQTPTKRAYMMKVERGSKRGYGERITDGLGRLQSLCDLALRLNTFTGVKWETWVDSPNRLGHFHKTVKQVCVEVQPPSAHERAESLLLLNDWLEGKVRETKRMRLLGVGEEIA